MTSVRTILGPLTTPFTYPALCSFVVLECSTCTIGWQGQTCSDNPFNTQGVQDNLDCWPPRENKYVTSDIAVLGWGFYSPGLQCPIGYSTACMAVGGVNGGFSFQFSLEPGETGVGCCPSGYTCNYGGQGYAQTCYTFYGSTSFPTMRCSAGNSDALASMTLPATISATVTATTSGQTMPTSTTTVVLNTVLAYAPLIQIAWQASDLSTAHGPSTSTSTATSGLATPSIAVSKASSSGLSKGATIGVAIAAAMVGLILIAIGTILFRRRAKRPKVMPTLPPGLFQGGEYKPPHEIGTVYVAEAPTERDAYEVHGSMSKEASPGLRYEMAG